MTSFTDLLARYPLPAATGGKDDRGTVLIIGGPPGCPGAVLLAGTAALRAGAGRVQLVAHPATSVALAVAVPEALVTGWDQTGDLPAAVHDQVAAADAVVLGPGHRELSLHVVEAVVEAAGAATVVLDAGALDHGIAAATSSTVLVAPNLSEAVAVVGPGDERTLAVRLSSELGRPTAVRGATTAIAHGADTWLFDEAPPGLGTPGSGDVFMGILATLLANGMPAVGALGWSVQLHAAAAGSLAAATPAGYLAREIVDRIPRALADARSILSGS
jgi:ADP-dependent NAD(P)H-hydrate dehydratase